jgi:spore photoproduct lyase
MNMSAKPKRLIVERSVMDSSLSQSLAERLPPIKTVDTLPPSDYGRYGPGDLLLTRHMGEFIKPCPGTRGYVCCGLSIIHFGLGCYLDCSYCILQSYLGTEALVVFGNVDEGLEQLKLLLAQPGNRPKRFCTGEFTDSLLLEDLTGLGSRLIRVFSTAKGAALELKTKTAHVDQLLDLEHGGRTIISFSMNAPSVSRTEESGAAPLKKRLQAAKRAASAGYRLGFHFDPLIRHEGWKDGYARTVEAIYNTVPSRNIAWISLGAFRYLPKLKDLVRRRFPHSRIMDEEFIPAPDGKMRYLRPIRVDMYRYVLGEIRRADPEACVYMCMESPRVWQDVFGFESSSSDLTTLLDKRV